MPNPSACPEPVQLHQLLQGQFTEAQAHVLEEHLSGCDHCGQVADGLKVEDTLADAVRAGAATLSEYETPLVRDVIGRMRQVRPVANPAARDATAAEHVTDTPSEADMDPANAPEATEEGFTFLSPPQGPDELGRLGGYRVLKVLGQGGMGVVFQAEDIHLERLVALKAMKPSVAANKAAKQRFLREAKACAALKHDHVITIHQVSEDNGVPFIAMEFLQGMPLDEWLAKGRKATVPQILRIGREIAKGLAAAHDKGLIHRDIKPGNIWLDKESGRVKILDFGLARTQTENVHITQSGAVVGTPAYMAPEQARAEPVDGRCDLFSLGCVLYRLCTGHVPFKGDTTMAVLMALAMETPPAVHEINPAIPEALSALIAKLLAKDAKDRPASAKEVIKAIQAIEGAISGSQTVATAPVAAPAIPAATPFDDLTEAGSKLVVPPKTMPTKKKAPASGGRQPPEKASPASPRGADAPRSPGRRKPLLVAALALLLGGVVLAGVILIIKGKKGDTVIELADGSTARIDGEKVTVTPPSSGPRPSVSPPLPLPAGASPFDALRKENIPAEVLAALGNVPAELVAIFGEKTTKKGSDFDLVQVSPDGRRIFASNATGTWVWETANDPKTATAPKLMSKWRGQITLSADGRRLAAVRPVQVSIMIVDTISHQEMPEFGRRGRGTGTYRSLALNPDGTRLVSVLSGGGQGVQIWDTVKGQELFTLPNAAGEPSWAAYSPDGKWLATCGFNVPLQTWSADNGKEGVRFPDPPMPVGHWPTFSADSSRLAWLNSDGVVVWDVESGAEQCNVKLPPKSGNINGLALRPDGKQLAIAYQLGSVIVYDVASGKTVRDWKFPVTPRRMTFAPDGRHLLISTDEATIHVLRLAPPPPATATALRAPAPAGEWVQLFNGKDLTGWTERGGMWTVQDGVLGTSARNTSLFTDREFHGDFHLRAEVQVEDQASGGIWYRNIDLKGKGNRAMIAGSMSASGGKMGGIGVRPPAREVAVEAGEWFTYEVIAQGNTIRVLVKGQETIELTDPNPTRGHIGLTQGTPKVSFRKVEIRQGSVAETASARSPLDDLKREAIKPEALKLFGPDPAKVPKELVAVFGDSQGAGSVTNLGLEISPDGRRLLATFAHGGGNGLLYAWDVATGQKLSEWNGVPTRFGMAMSPDGRRLAHVSPKANSVVISDAHTGKALVTVGELPNVGTNTIYRTVALNPDGTRLATANEKDQVKVWNAADGAKLFDLKIPPGFANELAYSPDGKWLVAHSMDETGKTKIGFVTIWNAADGTEVSSKPAGSAYSGKTLAISPDSSWLVVTGQEHKTMEVRDLATGSVKSTIRIGARPSAVSPDGKLIAAIAGRPLVVEAATGKVLHEWDLPAGPYRLAFSPDGRHLLTGNNDGTVYVLRLAEVPPTGSQLFNGKDLTGWDVLAGSWRYEDGDLIYKPLKEDRVASDNLVSKRTFRDFELKFQVQWKGSKDTGTGGLMIRGKVVDGLPAVPQGPLCAMGKTWWGGYWPEGPEKGRMKPPGAGATKALKPEDFNDYSIRCVGKHVTIKLNGETAIDDDFPSLPDEGILAWHVSARTPPSEVVIRNIEFTDLTMRPAPTGAEVKPSAAPLERVLAKLKAGQPITVVAMGDSLTAGNQWPTLLQNKLQEKYKSSVTLVNGAVGGTSLAQGLETMPNWLAKAPEPDLVTICFGYNDWSGGAAAFEKTCDDAVERIRRATNGKADVLLMTTVPSVMRWTTMAELAEASRRVARKRNAGLADTEKAFLEAGQMDKERLYVADKIHLSEAGHELMAQTVLGAIEKAGQPTTATNLP